MTTELPTKEGYYWWVSKYDGSVSAKEILKITKFKNKLYASGGEYNFEVRPPIHDSEEIEEEYWQYILEPEIP